MRPPQIEQSEDHGHFRYLWQDILAKNWQKLGILKRMLIMGNNYSDKLLFILTVRVTM